MSWQRWQDWATVILGAALVAMPFVTGTTNEATASWTSYILGGLIVIAGLFAASSERPGGLEYIPILLGIVLFAAPWVMQYTQVTALAWSAWIIGPLVVLSAGSELVLVQQPTS